MSKFDEVHHVENLFVKNNPFFMKSMFGKTDATPFWIADMDFQVATPITEALSRYVDRAIYAYEYNTPEVFRAISEWFESRHQLKLNPKNFIQVTNVLTGISVVIRELTKEGEGILIQTPVYHQFAKLIKAAKREVVENPANLVDGKYHMDFEDLEAKFQAGNVRIMILCNPHNPIGRVWKHAEIERVVELANKYSITLISDEIHADIVYDGHTFNSLAVADTEHKHITILGSPAKTFGMQSIASGYLYIPDKKLHQQIHDLVAAMYLDHGNALSGYATIAAYTEGGDWLDELTDYLTLTNAWIKSFLENEMPKVKLCEPEGTYQIWLDFSAYNLTEEELNQLIIHDAGLALAPGSWFGDAYGQFMRMNIASPLSVIQDAFTRLKKVLLA